MLHKVLFLLSGILTLSLASAQSTGVVGNVEIVKTTPVLKTLADHVNLAHADLSQQAITGTRSSAATAKANYDLALNSYLEELEHQLALGDKTHAEALTGEIALVQQLLGTTSTSTAPSR
jgi:hypothetical protein